MQSPAPQQDIRVENHGTLFLVRPLSPPTTCWLAERLDREALTFGRAYVVEPRFLAPIVAGAADAGLVVEAR